MLTNQKLLDSKIMIVDDQPSNILLLEQILEQAGYRNVKGLANSLRAIAMYQEFKPDLVLLDLNMPNMDGFDIMEALTRLEQNSYIPVLVLTAVDHPSVRHRALEAGAKDFLIKPFDITEVLCRIRNMLEVRNLHNQIRCHNQKLEEEVKIRTLELEDTRREVIHRLGRAAEYRDNETGNHVIRMSRFASLLAKALGCSTSHYELIQIASPMHDVGKIGIPDRILLKPGKLNSEEWEIMMTHVDKGVEILENNDSELIRMARLIAAHHHEKWDGSGYPRGLQGEAISLEGRIVALCDVFDALTSDRPYKKAWPVEEALNLIREQKGKHFEPRLVDIFLNIIPEIMAVKEEFSDSPEDLARQAEYLAGHYDPDQVS